jgi:hypothetical protein
MDAAYSRPQQTISATTAQKCSKTPMRARVRLLSAVVAMRADVRRWNRRRMRGAAIPPTICAAATMAATRPAIW